MDSRKSTGGESLPESLYSCTFIINVLHIFLQESIWILAKSPGENPCENGFSPKF